VTEALLDPDVLLLELDVVEAFEVLLPNKTVRF
jgi:hypothetical protein